MNIAKKVVGIIGIEGKYGQWLKQFFESLGCKVIGADVKTPEPTNQWVVEQAEVVIFSVNIDATVSTIEEAVPFSRPKQLWLDVTSLKAGPVKAMLGSKAEVVGLHPMCAPTVKGWRGQTVVICEARCEKWHSWITAVLKHSQAIIKRSEPKAHDAYMAKVQGLPHACAMVMGALLRQMDVDVSESLQYTSPFYLVAWSLIGRILHQSPELYAGIQMQNSQVLPVLDTLMEEMKRFRKIVGAKDKNTFVFEFNESSKHFGEKNHLNASTLFDQLIKFMADLSEDNRLEFKVAQNVSGVLHHITGILANENINLTSFHSVPAGEDFAILLVGIDKRKNSLEVQNAIKRIRKESFKGTLVEVLS